METLTAEEVGKYMLMEVDDFREVLKPTDDLSQIPFVADGADISFTFEDGWNQNLDGVEGTDEVAATVQVKGAEYPLTLDALLEATSLAGLPMKIVRETPSELIQPIVNYRFGDAPDRALKLLTAQGRGVAFTRESISPFSNERLLDEALESINKIYGDVPVYVDKKAHHDLRRTAFRLVVPDHSRTIKSGRHSETEEGDVWSTGVSVQNSLIGAKPLMLKGYLFAWWCRNGATTNLAETGQYHRKKQGQGDTVYDWARDTVEDILGGLEHQLDQVASLTDVSLDGSLAEVTAEVFAKYRVPMNARSSIMDNLVNSDDLSGYGLMNAITAAANDGDISENVRATLFDIGGFIPHAMGEICASCHRLA